MPVPVSIAVPVTAESGSARAPMRAAQCRLTCWPGRRSRWRQWLVLLVTTMLLSACGFHLRGAVPLPKVMAVTYIEGTPVLGELGRTLVRNLRDAGAVLTKDPKVATAILVILSEQMPRRVISVNRQGRANAYELDYRLRYTLKTPDGHRLTPPRSVSLQREYTFDPNNVLATGNEEGVLRQDMIGLAVRQMLRQLQTVGR